MDPLELYKGERGLSSSASSRKRSPLKIPSVCLMGEMSSGKSLQKALGDDEVMGASVLVALYGSHSSKRGGVGERLVVGSVDVDGFKVGGSVDGGFVSLSLLSSLKIVWVQLVLVTLGRLVLMGCVVFPKEVGMTSFTPVCSLMSYSLYLPCGSPPPPSPTSSCVIFCVRSSSVAVEVGWGSVSGCDTGWCGHGRMVGPVSKSGTELLLNTGERELLLSLWSWEGGE